MGPAVVDTFLSIEHQKQARGRLAYSEHKIAIAEACIQRHLLAIGQLSDVLLEV